MKITIKTLQQKVFSVSFILTILDLLLTFLSQVDAEPADTISTLKEKIAADQGHTVASQKIIFSGISTRSLHNSDLNGTIKGKVLSDDKTIESCQIKEKDFLVLMVSRVRFESSCTSSVSRPIPSPA